MYLREGVLVGGRWKGEDKYSAKLFSQTHANCNNSLVVLVTITRKSEIENITDGNRILKWYYRTLW